MDRQEFIKTISPYAEKASDILGIPAEWIAAHWAHETGYNINAKNNLAGIWAYPSSPYGITGKSYTNLDQFTGDYVKTLQNVRYLPALKANDVWGFAKGLKAGGYASDPNYAYAKTWGQASEMYKGAGSGSSGAGVPPANSGDAGAGWFSTAKEYWKKIFSGDIAGAEGVIKDYETSQGMNVPHKVFSPGETAVKGISILVILVVILVAVFMLFKGEPVAVVKEVAK